MKRVISFFLCAIMLMSSAHTVLATEITDISYNTLSVEFSDNLGTTEDLKAMVTEDHFYVDAEQLGDRLGYQVEVGNEYVAIYNKSFSNTVPYGLTAFYYDSTKVRHMLFNKMVDYEAPFKIVKNSDGVWIPFEFSLLLLNSSDVVLDNQVHIEMPQKNIIDIYMDSLSNTDCFLQSMYAGVVQSDTFCAYINRRNDVFGDAKNITPENLYELSQYCYAYLKSCYITRDAAVGSLTEKTKKNNPTYASTQKMVNQEIAEYLIKLKNADKTNKYGCYGFLPENNEQYLGEYDDSSLINCLGTSKDGEELYKDILDMYYYKIKNQNWTENDNVSILLSGNYSDYKSLSSVGYALLDIDGNGIPELLIGDNDSQSDGVIIDLYTYVDDKVVYLDTTYERFGINLSKNGKIYRYGSGGAYNNFEEECKIDEKNKVLVPIESIVFDGYYNPNSPWYYATGNYYTDSYDYDLDKMKNISEEEAMNKRKEFENNIIGYSITLFSDYIPQSDNDNISSNAGVYDEFLKNREYKNYIADSWTFGIPKQYSVMDIDGDGTDELLIYGSEDLWEDLAIFSFNSNTQQISLIPAMNYDSDEPQQISVLSAYGKIKYSEKYHAIVYSQYQNYSNGIACDSISYDVIKNGILDNDFIIGFGINSDTSEKEYYCGTENLTESEYNEYLAECSEISWMDLP